MSHYDILQPNWNAVKGLLTDNDVLLPAISHRRTIELLPAEINSGNPLGVGDVVEWVGVENDEVGALARIKCPAILQAEEIGGRNSRRRERLHRRHPGIDHKLQFTMISVGAELITHGSRVGAETDSDRGGVELCEAALHIAIDFLCPLDRVRGASLI